jgi:hypothetical protein
MLRARHQMSSRIVTTQPAIPKNSGSIIRTIQIKEPLVSDFG